MAKRTLAFIGWLIIGFLVIALVIQQAQATFLIIGETCLLVLTTIERVLANVPGLEQRLEISRAFCRGLVNLSIPVVALRAAAPILTELTIFVAQAGPNLPQQIPELLEILDRLISIIPPTG